MIYPTETQCPVCEDTFIQPRRPQGGGRRSIYCSGRCRSLDWVRGHGASRKAAVLKYENQPENKARKQQRERERRYAQKYGLEVAAVNALLKRQFFRCLGCNKPLTEDTMRVDHDHKSGRIRGLLCDQCNWALGLVRDNQTRLYQLAAYLELDRSRFVVYLIGSLRNPDIVAIGNTMRAAGFEIVDNWVAAGSEADTSWQEYSQSRGRTYKEALASREAQHTFNFDRAYLSMSDAAVMVLPAGRSAHLELGYIAGLGKPSCIYVPPGEEPVRFDIMPNVASAMAYSEEELVFWLNSTSGEGLK